MTTTTGFWIPGVTASHGDFVFNATIGGCVPTATSFTLQGRITGNCANLTGETDDGSHRGLFTSVGTALLFTGSLTGVASIVEDPTDAGSCLNGTANNFLVSGSFIPLHMCPPGFVYSPVYTNGVLSLWIEPCIPTA